MRDADLFDTREYQTYHLEPWMIGRFVEISVKWEDSTLFTAGGLLEHYASNTKAWSWKIEGRPEDTHERTKYRESEYNYQPRRKVGDFTLSVTVVVPSNWDHYGVDGSELAR